MQTATPRLRATGAHAEPRVPGAVLTELSLMLDRDASTPGLARTAVRDCFKRALSRETIADLELVVSELVTNAFEHGRGTIRLAIEQEGNRLRGSVTDQGSGFTYEPHAIDNTAVHGRGLPIVEALVTRWGIQDGSTHVWFEMTPGESYAADRVMAED